MWQDIFEGLNFRGSAMGKHFAKYFHGQRSDQIDDWMIKNLKQNFKGLRQIRKNSENFLPCDTPELQCFMVCVIY